MTTLEINRNELSLLIRGGAERIKSHLDKYIQNSLDHNFLETNSYDLDAELKRLKHLIYIYNEPRIEEIIRIEEGALSRCSKSSDQYTKTLNRISELTGLLK